MISGYLLNSVVLFFIQDPVNIHKKFILECYKRLEVCKAKSEPSYTILQSYKKANCQCVMLLFFVLARFVNFSIILFLPWLIPT